MWRHWNNKIIKSFKDYMVPIIWVLLISIIIINVITSDKNEKIDIPNNDIWNINVSLNTWSSASVVFDWWDKEDILTDIVLSKSEKLLVKSWSLNISLPLWIWSIVLDELWEFKYTNEWRYSLLLWNLWLDSSSNLSLDSKYLTVEAWAWSIISLEQNEIVSSVYVISWNVIVKNLAWISTSVSSWKKISILRTQWTDENLDLSTLVQEIPDYFKEDNWYKTNNWDLYLSEDIISVESTGSSILTTNIDYIEFNDLEDEDEFQTNTINVEWKILDDNISKIVFWWIEADIYSESNTFIIKNFELKNKENDIVYKVYNEYDDVIKKEILTLYTTKWSTEVISDLSVENYSLDSSIFKFTSPKSNPYTTTEELVRIDWTVPVWKVESITVNWYKLKKFPSYWANWYYFANVWYGNLKEWLNLYKINYFDKDWKIIFTNTFTIIKEQKSVDNTYSDEAKIN